jgi:eukaryotic-like serine/threonine-protein kinase
MAPPPVADRTETLAPREPSSDPARPPEPPITGADDPERYEQVAEHARGGLGRVVRAVDRRLGRTVAVKELLRRNDSNEARFMREALITARLEHPGIVPVHEAGRWPNGDPYYVMKLVEGRTLKELIAEHPTLRERLGLLPHVIAVADAVGYAHSEDVIHRDLKPSNVIVGEFGETIVVDWGLARDRKRDVAEPTEDLTGTLSSGSGSLSTVSGKVIGTPAYMSPEQARGELVDERADVYAIGAVLYEVLAGISPHGGATPQATLDRVIAGPPMPLAHAVAGVPSELATIVGKAMARDPEGRYPNATALAEDLRRFQTGKLVSAHSYTAWSLVRKKLAQHRGVVAVAVASTIALGGVGVEAFRHVVAEKNIAEIERGRTEGALAKVEKRQHDLVLLQAETSLRKDPTAALAWLKQIDVADTDRAELVDVIDEALALGVARHVFRPGDWVFDVAFTPDGQTLVAVVRDGVIRKYDLRTGTVSTIGRSDPPAETLALSPDGEQLITASQMGDVTAWPLHGGKPRKLFESGQWVTALRFSSDGRRVLVTREHGPADEIGLDGTAATSLGPKTALKVALATQDWTQQIVMTSPNEVAMVTPSGLRTLGHTDLAIAYIALSPCGDLALVHDGHTVWSVPSSGGPLRAVAKYEGKLTDAAWSPDQKSIALIGERPDMLLVDIATGAVRELRGHTDAIYNVRWSHDGKTLLTGGDDSTARVWTIADGSSIVLRGHDDDIYHAQWSADEHQVATASLDGSIRVWQLGASGTRTLSEAGAVENFTLDHDHALVKTPTTVARWDLATGTREPLFSWASEQHNLGVGVASPDGEELLVLGADWSMEVRRRSGPSVTLRGHHDLISHVEFSGDGKLLYSASYDGTIRRWDLATGASKVLLDATQPIRGFALAADGRVAAQVGDTATMIAPDGTMRVLGHGAPWCVLYAEFDKARDRLIMQRCNHNLVMLDGDRLVDLSTDGYTPTHIKISPDGNRIATGLADRTVRVWDAATGKTLYTLRGHTDLVMDVAFSPDGQELASASYDKTVRVWQLASERHRVLRGHSGPVDRIAWRNANELVTGSHDGTLRVWAVPKLEPPSADQLADRLNAATTAVIEADRPTS